MVNNIDNLQRWLNDELDRIETSSVSTHEATQMVDSLGNLSSSTPSMVARRKAMRKYSSFAMEALEANGICLLESVREQMPERFDNKSVGNFTEHFYAFKQRDGETVKGGTNCLTTCTMQVSVQMAKLCTSSLSESSSACPISSSEIRSQAVTSCLRTPGKSKMPSMHTIDPQRPFLCILSR